MVIGELAGLRGRTRASLQDIHTGQGDLRTIAEAAARFLHDLESLRSAISMAASASLPAAAVFRLSSVGPFNADVYTGTHSFSVLTAMARVRAANMHFSYPVYEVTGRSLKVSMMRQLAGSAIGDENGTTHVHAIRDLSFDVTEGDRVGIIGHNGSGKSTLLRLLSGLAYPQRGQLEIEGRVVSLAAPGLGVIPDLSGTANIELPLRLLGATDAEVSAAKEDVPEFTGLGNFMDLPVRTYSDGMRSRLAFALSTAIDADILVLDEWLGAGDAAFIDKAQARLNNAVSRAQILFLATHSVALVQSVCNLCLWLDRGRLCMMGPPAQVVDAYLASYQHAIAAQ